MKEKLEKIKYLCDKIRDYSTQLDVALDDLQSVKANDSNDTEKTYSIGQQFIPRGTKEEIYILAETGRNKEEVCLVCLQDGLKWTVPVEVNAPYNITEREFAEITDGNVFFQLNKDQYAK